MRIDIDVLTGNPILSKDVTVPDTFSGDYTVEGLLTANNIRTLTTSVVSNGNGGTNDNIDVSNVGTILANTAGGNVIIGGLTGGVTGQKLHIIKTNIKNILIIEDSEGVGDQDINTSLNQDLYTSPWGGASLEYDGAVWQVVSTSSERIFYIDGTNNDQGAASSAGKGLTIYDVTQLMTSNDTFTVIFPGTYEYNFGTSIDVSSYTKATFVFEPGASFTHDTDETITFYSPTQLDFAPRQLIDGNVDIIVFSTDTVIVTCVHVFPWVSASISNVMLPTGLWVDVSSSTTNGLQEGIDHAFGDGSVGSATYNLQICGRQDPVNSGAMEFDCSTTLSFPAMRETILTSGAFIIKSTASPAVDFDSMFGCNIDLAVEIQSDEGTDPVVLFKPTNVVPGDSGTIQIGNTNIKINSIWTTVDRDAANDCLVAIDMSNGNVINNKFEFTNINGNSKLNTNGIVIQNLSHLFAENSVKVGTAYAMTDNCVQAGDSGGGSNYCINNFFDIGVYGYGDGVGVDCYCEKNVFHMKTPFTELGGTLETDIILESTAKNNVFVTSLVSNLIDNSDGSNRIITSVSDDYVDAYVDQSVKSGSSPTLDGTNFTGVPISGVDDIVITDVADNELLAYNNGTSKWINQTPSEAGFSTIATSGDLSDASGTIDDIADGTTYVKSENNLTDALKTNYDNASTHVSSTGADHSYIDQDVTSGSSPNFVGTNISGVDADTVDGLEANQFVRKDVDDTKTGQLIITKSGTAFRVTDGTSQVDIDVNNVGYNLIGTNTDHNFYIQANNQLVCEFDTAKNITTYGNLTIPGVYIGSHDDITATSEGVAASVSTETTFVTTNGDSDLDNVTLADGTEGQTKYICCVAEGNAADTWKITPANMIGGTQITFSGVGEGCTLKMYSGGWVVVGNNGGTIS